MKDEEDFLPTIVPDQIPEPILLDETATLQDTIKADVNFLNTQMKIAHAMWSHIRTVKSAHDNIRIGMELLRERRNIRGHPYGAPANKASGSTVFEPVD